MTAATPSPDAALASPLEALAGLLRALGDPLRLLVLRVLARDSFGVLELCQLLDMKQPALSHHLKLLSQAGLLVTRREATTVYYRRSQHATASISRRVLEELDALPLGAAIEARLKAVQASRSEASQQFFRLNAGRFAAQQELIAGFADYGEASARHAATLAPATATVLEIGPGTGELLPLLAAHFQQVVGLDNSAEMLAKAALLVQAQPQVQLLLGDTRTALAFRPAVVVMNMVLHHVPEPAEVLRDIAALLPESGALVLTELCEHEQDWVREACGDVWLGFAPKQLSGWAATAGLGEGRADYLALKNGFRIQLREFIKG